MGLPTLQLGDQHELIPQLRARLANLGFMVGAAPTTEPTVFDSAVQSAVTAFQGKAQLVANGVVDAATWAALGVQDAGGGWGKILLYAAIAGGLYWWWRKRQRPLAEFGKRISRGGYGDAVDISLIEEPLLLMERGDCQGAARLLVKRRSYVGGESSPKNKDIFKRVAQKVIAHCPREATEEVRETLERSKEFERETGWPKSSLTKLEQSMRRKRSDAPRWWEREPSEEDPRQAVLPYVRRGARPFPREGSELRPMTGSGSKVVYLTSRGDEKLATVKRESGDTVLISGEGGGVQTIRRADVVRWLPKYAKERPTRVFSPEQKAKQVAATKIAREKRKEADRAEKQAENLLRRREPGLVRSSTGARGQLVTVRPPRGGWED